MCYKCVELPKDIKKFGFLGDVLELSFIAVTGQDGDEGRFRCRLVFEYIARYSRVSKYSVTHQNRQIPQSPLQRRI